jgi:glutathione S-transferase
MLAPPELKKIHPLGKSPVIGITPPGATEPTILAESGLIVEYLVSHYGKSTTLLPPQWREGQEEQICGETPQWMRYKYFLHYAEGSLMSLLVLALVLLNIKVNSPFFIRPIASRIASKVQEAFLDENFETHFAFLEDQLRTAPDGGGYLCGPHLTAADILLSFPLLAARNRLPGLKKDKYPLLWGYIEKLEQEQGYKKAANKIIEIEGRFLASL